MSFRPAALLCAFALLLGCAGGDHAARGAGRTPPLVPPGIAAGRNVLLITIDTLRADHLGCYGDRDARTPNIDALAQQGIRFEQAISAVPITLPSHATVMTGLDPPHHGVRTNGTYRLGGEHAVLAEILRSHGYATAAVTGAFVLDGRYGLSRGFDFYDDKIVPASGRTLPGSFHARRANVVTASATAWLERHLAGPRRPFFLWAHYYDPHFPYAPPGEYAKAFRDRPYDGEIAFVDSQIGALLDFLRARGALDDTLVVLTADHGEGLGQHGEATHMDLIYDSTLRVPLVLSSSRLFRGIGVVKDRVAGLVDVLPTVLGLLGIELAGAKLDGRNVTAAVETNRALYIETLAPYLDYGWAALHGLRRLQDKLILAPRPEYFDLHRDPGETKNLHDGAAQAVQLSRDLEERMSAWPADSAARLQGQPLDDEARERLTSLGYVRGAAAQRPSDVNPEAMVGIGVRIDDADQLGTDGKTAEAVEAIEAILREFPDAARALYMATGLYDELGRFDEGEKALRRALRLAPTSDGWVHLAWYAFRRGDAGSFDAALAQAERLDPMDGGIYLSRGHRELALGHVDRARAMFEKAREVDPVRHGDEARDALRALDAAGR